ncbi:MAG: hypothetical protein R3F40_00815 [Candidatus Competibacteraceae bacterium]
MPTLENLPKVFNALNYQKDLSAVLRQYEISIRQLSQSLSNEMIKVLNEFRQ